MEYIRCILLQSDNFHVDKQTPMILSCCRRGMQSHRRRYCHHHLSRHCVPLVRLGSTAIKLVNHLVLNVELALTILLLVRIHHLLVWIVHLVAICHSQVPQVHWIALIVHLVDMEQVQARLTMMTVLCVLLANSHHYQVRHLARTALLIPFNQQQVSHLVLLVQLDSAPTILRVRQLVLTVRACTSSRM